MLKRILLLMPRYLLPLVLVLWCAILLAQKIDLPLADLGRHIKNGEILLNAPWAEKWRLLHTNYYSYTESGHEFVNHHWLSGVVFYLVFKIAGFEGLSAVYIAVVTAAFFGVYWAAKKRAGSAIAAALAVLILPIIASRTEVRPEGFTYLFMAVFWIFLAGYKSALWGSSRYKLFLLPVVMLLWVNLHIGFIFGFVIWGAFFLEELIKDLKAKLEDKSYRILYYRSRLLLVVGGLCFIAALINPFFIKGVLYPLNIFRKYGYLIVENQSVMFLQRLGMGSGLYFDLFKFLLGLGALSFIIRFIMSVIPSESRRFGRGESRNPLTPDTRYKILDTKDKGSLRARSDALALGRDDRKRSWKDFPFHELLLLGTVGFLALFAIRNFPVFGLLFLPIVAGNIRTILPRPQHLAYKLLPLGIAFIIVIGGSFRFWESYEYKSGTFGLGLMPNVQNAAQFFISQNVKGPIFNNYDIGGYLIYNLYPKEKVFTDNRPEAYSVEHFQKIYIPMQQDEAKWVEMEAKYNFNAIFFSHRDLTPWGQAFLLSRVKDPQWAVVYADAYNIIFVKKNSQNLELIRKYLIPKENFGVTN